MVVLRIQFIGERAREIAQDENATNPKYPETLTKTLKALSIPYPDRVRPVWKSGVIMCHYSGELGSDFGARLSLSVESASRNSVNLSQLLIRHLNISQSGNPIPLPCKNTTKVKRDPYQVVFRSRDRRAASPPRASSSNSGSVKAAVRPAQPNRAATVPTPTGSVPTHPETSQLALQEPQWQQPHLHPQTPQSSLVEPAPSPQKETIPKSLDLKRIPTVEQINLAQQALQRLSESTNIQALFRDPPMSVQEELNYTPPSINIPSSQPLHGKGIHIVRDSSVPLPTKVQNAFPPTTPQSSKRRPTPTGPAALVAAQSQLSPVQRPHAIPTRPHANSISHQTPNAPTHGANGQASTLTRELWDVRRQMVALKARESSLMTQIKEAGGGDLAFEDSSHFSNGKDKMDSHVKQLENEIQDLKHKLKRTSSQLEDAEDARDNEKKRRIQAERLWDDARREYRAPLVVPAMMDAFEKLARLASDALSDMNNDDVVIAGRRGWGG